MSKLVPILSHMGTPTTRKTRITQPCVYCCTSLFAVPRGSSGWGVGSKPCGHRGAGKPDNPQALVQRIHGPEDSSATLWGEWEWGLGMVLIIISMVIQISKRIQLVTIYKRQHKVGAFTFPSARSESLNPVCVTR